MKHGKWILEREEDLYAAYEEPFFYCSECETREFRQDDIEDGTRKLTNYCPHCGAKMEGNEEYYKELYIKKGGVDFNDPKVKQMLENSRRAFIEWFNGEEE